MESNFCRLDIVREIPLLELNFCISFLEDLGGTFLPKLIYLQRKDLDLQNLQYCFAKVLKLKSLNIVAVMQLFFKKHEDYPLLRTNVHYQEGRLFLYYVIFDSRH